MRRAAVGMRRPCIGDVGVRFVRVNGVLIAEAARDSSESASTRAGFDRREERSLQMLSRSATTST